VAVTEKATGVKREATTNGDGIYVLSNLAPGEYDVKIEAKGFARKVSSAPVVLSVGQVVSLDARLEVNSLESSSTIIDLVEYRPLIDTNTSVVDGVIDSREVGSLPLNGRNFLELALLIPGNSPAPNFDPTKTNTVVISSAGQLGRGGNVTVDGADDNDDVVGGQVQKHFAGGSTGVSDCNQPFFGPVGKVKFVSYKYCNQVGHQRVSRFGIILFSRQIDTRTACHVRSWTWANTAL